MKLPSNFGAALVVTCSTPELVGVPAVTVPLTAAELVGLRLGTTTGPAALLDGTIGAALLEGATGAADEEVSMTAEVEVEDEVVGLGEDDAAGAGDEADCRGSAGTVLMEEVAPHSARLTPSGQQPTSAQ